MLRAVHHAPILYAEDDALVRCAITELLEEAGYGVEACADGDAALDRLTSAARYDLLLFDNELPFVSGAELVRHARGLARYSDAPIIIISASGSEEDARRAGADLFLRKPEDVSRLIEVVCRLLEGRSA